MKQNVYARKRRQLRYLLKKLRTSPPNESQLLDKAKRLLNELHGFLSRKEWQKALATLGLLAGLSGTATAQSFGSPQTNPFSLVPVRDAALPTFGDLDGDGDLDLLVGEYYGGIKYFENTGNVNSPQFAAPVNTPFGIDTSNTAYVASPELVDMDGDGDLDLFIGTAAFYSTETLIYQENTGTAAAPAFAAPQINPLGINDSNLFMLPTTIDLDGDGDFDIMSGIYGGAMMYYENTGSATNPVMAPGILNPLGIDSSVFIAYPAFADLDEDGDMDLLVGTYDYGNLRYFENTGDAQNPQFAPAINNPFGMMAANYYAFPAFADLDGDADMDLLVGEYYGEMVYYENTTDIGVDEYEAFDLKLWPNPASDQVNIDTQEAIAQVLIMDVKGRQLYSISQPGLTISLPDLPKGSYLMKITNTDKQSVIRKLSIQ